MNLLSQIYADDLTSCTRFPATDIIVLEVKMPASDIHYKELQKTLNHSSFVDILL